MFRFNSESDLLQAFRPRDRRHVELPKGRTYPLTALDYLSWTDETGERAYLVFKAPGETFASGVMFRRDKSVANAGPRMCHWCHSGGASDQITLLSCDVNSRRRVGVYLCADLGCGQRLEDEANRRGKSARDAVNALLLTMSRFCQQSLGISQSNRNAPAP